MKTNTIVAIAAVIVVVTLASAFLIAPILAPPSTSTTTTSKPCIQKAYFSGTVYCFSVARAITNANQSTIASAQVMYVVTYPQLNSLCSGNLSNCKPETLLSGYSPQCNPCVQEAPSIYHDHVLAGLPSSGSSGNYAIVVVAYNPSFSGQAAFTPMKSAPALTAGESAGDFARINPSGTNPYQMSTTTVLVISVYPPS